METIILVGHGSPRKKANRMDEVARLMHAKLHPGCTKECVRVSYMEFGEPNVPAALDLAVKDGASSIIVHPFFLNAGVHVTKDIPGMVDEARARHPETGFIYTEPLGMSDGIVQVAIDRINEARGIETGEIEKQSFQAIAREAELESLPGETHPIVKRVIHTTADFEYLSTLSIHPEAVKAGVEAIRAGKDVLTDVEMVRVGINQKALSRFGGRAVCHIAEAEAKDNMTRSEQGIETGLGGNTGIVAIGNAPTALIKCIDLINSGKASPSLVVGVPVGFVRAVESKALLSSQDFPYITNIGRKGGSTVAAAIVNALIKIAEEQNA